MGNENVKIRVVNYVAGFVSVDGSLAPVINHRIEQLLDGHWVTVPVYQEAEDGTLTEIPQSFTAPSEVIL